MKTANYIRLNSAKENIIIEELKTIYQNGYVESEL